MVYHSVILDIQKNTSSCVLDIVEKDKNSHQLLIKLVCDEGHFYNISGYRPEIEFFDNSTNTKVLTTAVDIVNAYRGYLSYVLGERIVQNPSRYTVTLRLIGEHGSESERLSCSFILNILRDPSRPPGCDCHHSSEVTISKEFYDELKNHLDNRLIHVSESDRAILTFLTDNLDSLVTQEDLIPINQNLSNLNEITGNLTTNVSTMSTNVINLTQTVEALASQIGSYTERINEAEMLSKQASKDSKAALSGVEELQSSLNWVELP